MSVAEVRRRSQELQDRARRRLAAIYVGGVGNAGIPLILMWFLPELRLALGYLVVTALFLVSFVRHRSTVQAVSPEMTAAQGLAFYRQALERERDVRRDSTWWFTVGPALNILILGLAYIRSPLFHEVPRVCRRAVSVSYATATHHTVGSPTERFGDEHTGSLVFQVRARGGVPPRAPLRREPRTEGDD